MKNELKQYIYRVKSPAKVNVGLRVLSKRKDGFHNLESIFCPVKIFDITTVKIKKLPLLNGSNKINVTTDSKEKISGKSNICYKTAEKFFEIFKINGSYRIDIFIKKNIPTGAGLGGGSSDAASVLKILLKHFRINVTQNNSLRFAMELGSDVPFFLLAKPGYALGRGEKLTPLPKFKLPGKLLLVNPGIHISTPWAFKSLEVKRAKSRIMNRIIRFSADDPKLMVNDFERVVFKKYPEIEKIKYDMYSFGASYSLMSGSGSTVYGIFSSSDVKTAEKYFKLKKYKVFVS
ncbi:MAG: 4-(cytidine 5'-diphospho)-2-C-methyl-D-erythritol kinase [Ignavibacteria bacterium]|nr:4-(cytidine 5'-diphospho)-2-C-methyl-D-erythritol kinase [Ignavibacteria bacterium]